MSKNTGTSELINYFDLGVNGDVGISGNLTLDTIANATTDTDKFLVSDTGIIKYRTGAQLLSDIGAQGALTNPVTGTGTSGTIPVFTGSTTIGNSIIQSNATQVNVVGNGSQLLFDSLGASKTGGIGYINDFVLNVYNSRGTGSAIQLGNNNIDLITDDTTRLTILDTGEVGIGTATPNTKLQIDDSSDVILKLRRTVNANSGIQFESTGVNTSRLYGASDSYALRYFYNSDEYLRISATGNVLIGSPPAADNGARLQVSGGSTYIKAGNGNQIGLDNYGERFTQIIFNNNTVTKANIWWDNTNTELVLLANSVGTGHLRIASTGAATFTGNINQNINDGAISLYKSDGTTLKAFIGNLNGTTTDEGYLALYKTNVQKVAIRASGTSYFNGGNVLIGTTTDGGRKLEIQTGSTNAALWVQTGGATSAYTIADFRTGTNLPALQILGNGVSYFGGNVGIGTNSPSSLLDVEGPSGASGSTLFTIKKAGGFGSTEFFQYYNSSSDYGINFGLSVSNATNGRAGIIIRSDTGGNGTLVFNTSSTERMRITSDGKLIVRQSYMTYPVSIEAQSGGGQLALTRSGAVAEFYMGGSTGATTQLYVRSGGSGGVRLDAGSTGWVSASDIRLKDITKPIENAVESLSSLQTIYYSWKDSINKNLHIGLIAQEVEKVFPELVSESSIDGMKGVNYTELIPVIIKAIQELNEKINK